MPLVKNAVVHKPKKPYLGARITFFCLAICIAFVFTQTNAQSQTQPQNQPSRGTEITNAGIGYSFRLPAGWDELNPILMQLYNSYAGSVAGSNGEAVLMLAAYSKSAPGSSGYSLPSILFMHYVNQPITAEMVEPYNRAFIDEAKDDEGKTRVAKKLGLASSVTYLGSSQLKPGTPLVSIKANTSFGFTGKVISAPFYSSEGVLTMTFFAPEQDFATLEKEVLSIFKSLNIFEENVPR